MLKLPRVAILILLLPSAAALNAFQLNGDPECDNGLTFENVQLTCGSAYQGYQYGYNINQGYGNGYRYNGGYNNGGQYSNSYNSKYGQGGQASSYMNKYYNANGNNQNYNNQGNQQQQDNPEGNGNYDYNAYMNGEYQNQQQQQGGPGEEQYYMNNINGQVAGWTPQGSPYCMAGDTAYVTGTISIPQTGLYGYDMKNRVCVYGKDWGWLTCKEINLEGASFCSLFGLMAYGCPEAGQFQVTTSFNLPAQGEGYDLASGVTGWYSYIYTTLNTTDGFVYTCKTRVDTVNPNSNSYSNRWSNFKESSSSFNWSDWYSQNASGRWSSSSYFLFGLSIVGVAGLISSVVVRRRRLRGQIDLAQEESDATGSFEMMSEGVARV